MRRGMLGLAPVLVACVSTNAALLNPSLKLAPVCPDGVQVFTDSTKVGKPYTEVAVLNSKGSTEGTSEGGMINSQRKKAAALGASEWLSELPALVAGLQREWRIAVGPAYEDGTEAFVARATHSRSCSSSAI